MGTIPSVTAIYSGFLGLLLLALSYRVTRHRQRAKIGIGDGGDPDLARAIRAHANFVEYVPLALLLLLACELAGGPPWLLHGAGAVLLASRALHAQGLSGASGLSPGRFYGTLGTWIVLLALALAALWLGLSG